MLSVTKPLTNKSLSNRIMVLGQTIEISAGYFIPINPDRLADIRMFMRSKEPDLESLYGVIAQDVGLSAVTLKTINNPAFGFRRQVTDIKQSIMLLGADYFRQVLEFDFIHQSVADHSSISLERFWDSSYQLALLTTYLIEYLKLKSDIPFEDAFAAGLFLDCGIPVMAERYDNYLSTLKEANKSTKKMFTEVEDDSHNTNHAVMGYYIAKSWELPDIICETIRSHHDDEFLESDRVSTRHKDLHGLLKLTGSILNRIKYGQTTAECLRTRDSVLSYFNLSDLDFQELEQDILDQYAENFEFG